MIENKKPMMNDDDIDCISNELLSKQNVDVLEWGSGISTLFFTELLKKNNIKFRWDSIEHNPKWYKHVQDNNKNVELKVHLFQHENPLNKLTVNDAPMDDYVNAPRMLWRKYDIIIVDGMKRERCLRMTRQFMKKNAVLFLHDAERTCYHEVLKEYKGEFLTKTLWMGKI